MSDDPRGDVEFVLRTLRKSSERRSWSPNSEMVIPEGRFADVAARLIVYFRSPPASTPRSDDS